MAFKLDIVTIEGSLYSKEVDMVTAPGIDGQMGILPNHAPLLTALDVGVLKVKRGLREEQFAIGGGYMEILPHQVTILADTSERAEDIDLERAEAARERAQEYLRSHAGETDTVEYSHAQATLRKSTVRIKLARTQRRRRPARPGDSDRSTPS